MDIRTFIQDIRFRDIGYGLVGALLAGANCFIATIVYPDLPVAVVIIGILVGFFAGLVFGSAAVEALLHTLGVV